MKITARIEQSKGKGLWLFVDREGQKTMHADSLPLFRDEDKAGEVAYAILPEEIMPIMEACISYLAENKV